MKKERGIKSYHTMQTQSSFKWKSEEKKRLFCRSGQINEIKENNLFVYS